MISKKPRVDALLEDEIEGCIKAVDDAESCANQATDAARTAREILNDMRKRQKAANRMADMAECVVLPLKAIDTEVEDGNGTVIATFTESHHAEYFVELSNLVGGFDDEG